jgi:hypothetical protein
MLFDFQAFIEELREKAEKKQIVEKYEKFLGPITGNFDQQEWYTQYVSQFDAIECKVPEELKSDFDWNFLQQLVLASFSSDYELKKAPEDKDNADALKDLYIAVKSGDQSVVKTVSELWSFQILRLYEIYIEEQINLHALMYEDEKEKTAIQQEREMRLKRRKLYLETMDKDELKAKAKEEQEGKLGSLYDQL